jgi:mono/diheme cytochrome c family protein
MKRSLFLGAVLAVLIASPSVLKTEPAAQTPAAGELDQHKALLTTYCVTCHNSRSKTGGLALDSLDLQSAPDHAEVWEKAIRKLRGRLMPPPGSRQPDQKDIDAFVAWLENDLDKNAKGPKAGHVGIQRLNRTEYVAAVKDLLGVDLNAKDILPQDVSIDGFDNIAAGLSVSPAFVEQYVEAARMIAKRAVGDPSLDSVIYRLAQNRGAEAMPLGLRDGGMRLKHNFQADGEYRINVHFPDQTLGLYGRWEAHV